MEAENLERLLTSVGFPIVMCIILIYYIVKLIEKQTDELKELRKAIHENTSVLSQVQTIISIARNEK